MFQMHNAIINNNFSINSHAVPPFYTNMTNAIKRAINEIVKSLITIFENGELNEG